MIPPEMADMAAVDAELDAGGDVGTMSPGGSRTLVGGGEVHGSAFSKPSAEKKLFGSHDHGDGLIAGKWLGRWIVEDYRAAFYKRSRS